MLFKMHDMSSMMQNSPQKISILDASKCQIFILKPHTHNNDLVGFFQPTVELSRAELLLTKISR